MHARFYRRRNPHLAAPLLVRSLLGALFATIVVRFRRVGGPKKCQGEREVKKSYNNHRTRLYAYCYSSDEEARWLQELQTQVAARLDKEGFSQGGTARRFLLHRPHLNSCMSDKPPRISAR